MIGPAFSDLPVAIAFWAGAICLAIVLAVPTLGALYGRLRGKPEVRVRNLTGQVLGASVVFAIPCAIATVVAMIAGAALLAAGAPVIVYPFISLAGAIWLGGAARMPGHEMQGCTKLIGLIWGCYMTVWGLVALHFTGGFARLAAEGVNPVWLTPFLAALPFALLFTHITGKKRTGWTFPTAFGLFAVFMALCYFPIQAGTGIDWLPENDWLRFPLAGLAIGLVLALVPLLVGLIGSNAMVRARLLRAQPRGFLIGALLVTPTGLAWAAAREIVATL